MAKVDILNYISDSNILRSIYDTDTNELDITDVPQNLNSVITLGQSGGSGPFEMLSTASISESVRAVTLDLSSYINVYDIVVVFIDFTLSSTDYLSLIRDSATPTYSAQKKHQTGIALMNITNSDLTTSNKNSVYVNNNYGASSGLTSNLEISTYTASKTIDSGKYIIFGGKYADM